METLLIRERYKIVQVLHAQPDYAFAEAVDIQDRQTPACLVNVYEGAWLPRYAEVYAGLEGCPAFQGAFLQGESLVAVFQPAQGLPIDRVFYRGARWGWRDRLEFAQLLLHQALTLCGLPPEIGCAALFSENVLVDVDKRRVDLRYFIRPLEGMTPRELTLLAADQVEKILLPRFSSADGELAFLKQLRGESSPAWCRCMRPGGGRCPRSKRNTRRWTGRTPYTGLAPWSGKISNESGGEGLGSCP